MEYNKRKEEKLKRELAEKARRRKSILDTINSVGKKYQEETSREVKKGTVVNIEDYWGE